MKFAVENKIPFIKDRLEKFGDVIYLSPENFKAENLQDVDAIVVRTRTRCNAGLLAGTAVKCIVTATIGTDHIDMDFCYENGIAVYNAPGCNAPGVAQYVWTSLLQAGFQPDNMTLGIIGYGNVGRIVAEWGRAMGAKILVNDPPLEKSWTHQLPPEGFTSINDLLKKSDAVTLHVPYKDKGKYSTKNLLGSKELKRIKKGAIVINSSRGGILQESAIKRNTKIKYIIDTWENEPEISSETINQTLFASCHIAGYSREGKQRATRMALEALGKHFGFSPDVEDLEPAYSKLRLTGPELRKRLLEDADSVWPWRADTKEAMIKFFEQLRSVYALRGEP